MNFKLKAHNALLYQEQQVYSDFIDSFDVHYTDFKSHNIIVHIASNQPPDIIFIAALLKRSHVHQAKKKSFVVVASEWSINDFPNKLVVVPTSQEAEDLIEMDEMQRDLGF